MQDLHSFMPRKRRIEFPGALYHVLSRGNYRKELFLEEGSGERFEETLMEAVDRCGWRVFSYVIMSNHFHLALETPEPNLVTGMKWLQGTFATRFNRFRKESGHVFQGRYKAILVGEGRPLLGLIDYIHLNPVRAGNCGVDWLKGYRLSSYPKYWKQRVRKGLDRAAMLSLIGAADSVGGMRKYLEHLNLSEAQDPGHKEKLQREYCRGWFIGPKAERKELAKELAERNPAIDWELADYAELTEERWEMIVREELNRRGKDEKDLAGEAKGARWKAEIALRLRLETTAGNPWIASRLQMGHPSRVSNLLRDVRNV